MLGPLRKIIRRAARRSLFLKDQKALAKFSIGEWSYGRLRVIQWDSMCNLVIGKYCSIAEGTTVLLGGEHHHDWVSTYPFDQLFPTGFHLDDRGTSKGDVIIGNDVWIGRETLVMSGVTIGDGAVIGARSLVTRDVPAYSISAGHPARHLRLRFDEEVIRQLLRIAWWKWPHEKVRGALPLLMSNDIHAFIGKYADSITGTEATAHTGERACKP